MTALEKVRQDARWFFEQRQYDNALACWQQAVRADNRDYESCWGVVQCTMALQPERVVRLTQAGSRYGKSGLQEYDWALAYAPPEVGTGYLKQVEAHNANANAAWTSKHFNLKRWRLPLIAAAAVIVLFSAALILDLRKGVYLLAYGVCALFIFFRIITKRSSGAKAKEQEPVAIPRAPVTYGAGGMDANVSVTCPSCGAVGIEISAALEYGLCGYCGTMLHKNGGPCVDAKSINLENLRSQARRSFEAGQYGDARAAWVRAAQLDGSDHESCWGIARCNMALYPDRLAAQDHACAMALTHAPPDMRAELAKQIEAHDANARAILKARAARKRSIKQLERLLPLVVVLCGLGMVVSLSASAVWVGRNPAAGRALLWVTLTLFISTFVAMTTLPRLLERKRKIDKEDCGSDGPAQTPEQRRQQLREQFQQELRKQRLR